MNRDRRLLLEERNDDDTRAKYSSAQKQAMLATGNALLSPVTGKASFPIQDHDDVKNAVKAVGLGGTEDEDIRKHIMTNAKKIGAAGLIPPSWNADGTKKERHRSASPAAEIYRAEGIEQRSTSTAFTLSGGKGDTATVEGCAIRYSPVVSHIRDHLGTFAEEIAGPQAVNGADISDIRFLVGHDSSKPPLARWCPGKGIDTLTLDNRSDGLYFRSTIDLRSSDANNLAVALDNKSIDQCSYGFSMEDGGQQRWNTDYTHRTINRYGSISDISIVTFPAEPSTSADIARSLARDNFFVRQVVQEHRSGRKISKDTKAKLATAVGHLTAAGVNLNAVQGHLSELMSDGTGGAFDDGTSGGNSGNGSNQSGMMNPDMTGFGNARSAADDPKFRKWIQRQRRNKRDDTIRRAEQSAHERSYDVTT